MARSLCCYMSSAVLFTAIVSAVPSGSLASRSPGVDYSAYYPSYFVPWANGPHNYADASPTYWPFFLEAIDPYLGIVDTQSEGIIIAGSLVGATKSEKNNIERQGRRYFADSNTLYTGVWVHREIMTQAEFEDDGPIYFRAGKAPLFAVTQVSTCTKFDKKANKCAVAETNVKTASADVRKAVKTIIGVGFNTGQPVEYNSNVNPWLFRWLDLFQSRPSLDPSPGYIMTHNGVYLGFTGKATAGFVTRKLPSDAKGNWTNPTTTIRLGGKTYPPELSLDNMEKQSVLTVPGKQTGSSVSSASATVGTDEDQVKLKIYNGLIRTKGPSTKPTVVYGRDMLKDYDYMFDHANGYIGFRKAVTTQLLSSKEPEV